jgi:chemotaxis protein histidine kinase CheA
MLIDHETIDIYIEETNQSLAEIEENLLVLENLGDNIDISLARRIYHDMYVIRNGASLLSLSKTKELSQKIENVMGLICTQRLTPNPEVINILLQGIDCLHQLIDLIHSNEDIDIDEQSVLLTGLTSAVLPDDIKQSVTEVREIPLPDAKHVFQIPEFNIIQELEQGKKIFILRYDLIKDVQEKSQTPFDFVRFIQQHGEMIDSVFDITSIGTLEEQELGSEMPYFVLLATTLSFEQLIKSLGVQSHQIKQVKSEIADLIHSSAEPHQKKVASTVAVHDRKTGQKKTMNSLNALSCELKFAMDCFTHSPDSKLSLAKARIQSVSDGLQKIIHQNNRVLASKILWKIGRNIRDHAYQFNIQAKLDLQCGTIKIDQRICNLLIDPVTQIIVKMIRLVQTHTTVQICLNISQSEDKIKLTLSFSNPQILTQKNHLEFVNEEKKIHAFCAEITQSFAKETGLFITIHVPKNLFFVPGYRVIIDDQNYIIPKFNVKDCLTNLSASMWREKDSCIAFDYNEQAIPVAKISNTDLSYFKNKKSLIVCEVGNKRFGLSADSVEILECDAVFQTLSKQLDSNAFIAASCLLDDGQIALIPDMGFLAQDIS